MRNDNELHLQSILKVLQSEGVLPNVILIGSWCLLFYKSIFEDFEPSVRTTDVDFYVPDSKRIKEKNGLIKSLKEINYDLVYDCLTNKSSFISPDGFELEFLTKLNRERLSCVKLGNTGVYAESLSYLDIFTGNYIEVHFKDLLVKVASPSSFVLQKLMINDERKTKQEKDIEAIKNVLFYIGASLKNIDELNELYNSLSKRSRIRIDAVCKKYDIKLPIDK